MLGRIFHHETDIAGSAHTRGKTPPAPPEKRYPRFTQIPLPSAAVVHTPLLEAMRLRRSADDFSGTIAPSLASWGTLLDGAARSRRERERTWRSYPSGGGLYPLELYVAGKVEEKMGLFHYAHATHALEHLFPQYEDASGIMDVRECFSDAWRTDVPSYVLISAVWRRSEREYGDFAYRLIQTEAGHLMQNLHLMGAALSISMRISASVDAERIGALLDLEETEETVLYGVALGEEKKDGR